MSNASDFPRELMIKLSANEATRLFRNNTGLGWVGRATRITRPMTVQLPAGSVVIQNARPLHAGLCEGSSDLIGWQSVEVTQEMVGRRVALFVALEAKTGTGRLSKEQRAFIEAVDQAGGVAGEARSVGQTELMLATLSRGR